MAPSRRNGDCPRTTAKPSTTKSPGTAANWSSNTKPPGPAFRAPSSACWPDKQVEIMHRLFLKLFRRHRLDRDLQAELAFHRDMSAAHHNPIPLGNSAVIREQAFDLWRFNFAENLWRDLVYAARGLRHSPALVLTALLSLGLGIGVNTAMFSLGVEFLFSEPSVRDAGSLVNVSLGGDMHAPRTALDFVAASGLFDEVAGENEESITNYNDGAETHRAFNVFTTKNYFTVL